MLNLCGRKDIQFNKRHKYVFFSNKFIRFIRQIFIPTKVNQCQIKRIIETFLLADFFFLLKINTFKMQCMYVF